MTVTLATVGYYGCLTAGHTGYAMLALLPQAHFE
jgi:hypothetical protein